MQNHHIKKPETVAVIGAGSRGRDSYGRYIKRNPDRLNVVAVAEPDEDRRKLFSQEHDLEREARYTGWKQLMKENRLAEGIIISTMDDAHVQPAIKALERGYKVLLEKPISPDLEGIKKLYGKYKETGGIVLVAHVLRYTRFFQKLKELLEKGSIGKVRFVDLMENIGFFHFAHSYVRGNWRSTDVAAPIILAKSCHDLDILHWLLGTKTKELYSHGSREVFRAEEQPDGASDRCLDCELELECPYSARKIYLRYSKGNEWPASVISGEHSREGRLHALRKGPYGRCVWQCDNDVPEVQTVHLTQTDNTEVNFMLTAFSKDITREIKIYGSRGEIRGHLERGEIEVSQFGQSDYSIDIQAKPGGHNGGDTGLMDKFVEVLGGESKPEDGLSTSLDDSIESHLLAFAAERSRDKGSVINPQSLREKL